MKLTCEQLNVDMFLSLYDATLYIVIFIFVISNVQCCSFLYLSWSLTVKSLSLVLDKVRACVLVLD